MLANQGFPPAYTGFQGAHKPIVEGDDKILNPPKNQLEEAPNLSQIDRSYWLSADPLPVTEANLLRGKEIFLDRCVGCHGLAGDGKGPGAQVPLAAAGRLHERGRRVLRRRHGPGRLLLPHPARLAGNGDGELRRAALGRRHLARRAVHQDDPEPHARAEPRPEPSDFIVWQPSKELLAWLATSQKLTGNVSFKKPVTDPFMQEAMRIFPGLTPKDHIVLNDKANTPLSLDVAAAGIKALYEDMLNRAWNDRAPAATSCRRVAEGLPPDRAGTAMRRLAATTFVLLVTALALPASVRARPARDEPLALGHGRLDARHVLHLLRARFIAFLAAWKAGHFHDLDQLGGLPLLIHEEDYYTPDWALDEEEWADGNA